MKRTAHSGRFAAMWSRNPNRTKILRQNSLLTGGFTLISTGVGMHFGLWLGLVTGGVLAVAYEWHLGRSPE